MATSDIGGGANDYATITAWELATRGSTEEEVGVIYAGTYNEQVDITGGGAFGRRLEVATGAFFNPTTLGGVIWTAGSSARYVLRVSEDNFSLFGGIGFFSTYTGATNFQVIRVNGGVSGVQIRGAYVEGVIGSTATNRRGIYVASTATDTIINSCIVIGQGSGGALQGLIRGIEDDGTDSLIVNNVVIGIYSGSSNGIGIQMDNASGECRNNCVYDEAVSCFSFASGVTHTNNVSSDATATGTDSFTNSVLNDDIDNAAGGSFGPKRGGNLIDTGIDVVGAERDYLGKSHNADGFGREIGAVNFDTGQQITTTIPVQTDIAPSLRQLRRVGATVPVQTAITPELHQLRRVAADINVQTDIAPELHQLRRVAATIEAQTLITPAVQTSTPGGNLVRIQATIPVQTAIAPTLQVQQAVEPTLYRMRARGAVAGVAAATSGPVARVARSRGASSGVEIGQAATAGVRRVCGRGSSSA